MDYNVIKERHSVRSYTSALISEEIKAVLVKMIDECNEKGDLNMQLVTDEPEAFGSSLLARYGKFSNVSNYVCMIAQKGKQYEEKIGYYGELFVLKAQQLGLNTCWVGMTFSKGHVPAEIGVGEKLYAVIAVGYGQTSGSTHKVKTSQQVCRNVMEAPDWVKRGVDCALLAPSSLNKQNFSFKWLGGNRVKASTSWGFYNYIDLGIAKLHFELGASPESVEWE
ncbi:MAG: nitroreductase [Bacteroides sp.]|nr:nitroreductase [Bacteroides sp.]